MRIGQVSFSGWIEGEPGIQRIVFTDDMPMYVYTMNLTVNGFDLTFTRSIDMSMAIDRGNYKLRSYRYEYKKKDIAEGVDIANQVDIQAVPIKNIQLSKDGRKVSLLIDKLKQGFIYELRPGDIKSSKGQPLAGRLICYMLNKIRT